MTKSLAISGRFRANQLVGGVASYFQNLTRGIAEVVATEPRYRDVAVTMFHGPAGVPFRPEGFQFREQSDRGGRFIRDSLFGLFDSGAFDAAFFPNYFTPPAVRAKRVVAVIHDLLNKNMPHLKSWQSRAWLDAAQRRTLRRCDAVVTISHAVKADVLRWFGDQWEAKVHPIWNPIAIERLDGEGRYASQENRPYLLGVAVDRPFKNLYTLIRSFAKFRERSPDHRLVLVGELRSRRPKSRIHSREVSARMPTTVDLVDQLGLHDHVTITGFVTDEELGSLYRGADAFVLPSLFEGFGMPAIEAMALGTPAIVSDIPVLREVTLGLARYVDQPENVELLAETLAEVVAAGPAARPSPETIADLRRQFSPRTAAAKYLELFFPN